MTRQEMNRRWVPIVTTVKMPVIERIEAIHDGKARCVLEDGQTVCRPVAAIERYYQPEIVAA